MKRKLTILSVLAAVYLVVSVAPVSAAHVAMVSSHTTASELSNGSLSNADVERSGDAGYVGHDNYRDGLSGRWGFDYGSGSTAYNHGGPAGDGAISGGTWVQSGTNTALELSSGDYVRVPDSNAVGDDLQNGFTITSVVNVSIPDSGDGNTHQIIGKDTDYSLHITGDGELRFDDDDTGGVEFDSGGWDGPTHVAVRVNSRGHTWLYKDGELLGSGDWPATMSSLGSSTDVYIGNRAWVSGAARPLDGRVHDLRIYSEVLTPGEIVRQAEHPNAKLTDSVMERWALDAGTGDTAISDGSTNGALKGGPTWTSGLTGSALSLDGSDDSVNIGNSIRGSYSSFTYVGSFKSTSSGYITSTMDGDGGFRVLLTGDGYVNAGIRSSSDGVTGIGTESGGYNDGNWHTIVFTRSSQDGYLRLYVDGTLVDSAPANTMDAGRNGFIGYSDWFTGYLQGQVDEVRFYQRALSNSSIERVSAHPAAGPEESSSYTSPDHGATYSVKGYTDLTLENATATVTWKTAGGTVLNQSTFSSSGNHTLTWAESGADNVEVVVDFDTSSPDYVARLHGDGVFAATNSPTVDDSSLSPNSTSETVGSLPVTLSASVSDPDFGTVQGDSATVEWYVDGSKRGETTISSNGTTSYELSSVDSGTHDWHVEVTDEDGHTDTSATGSFAMPGELKIYNESAPNSLVDSATVNIQFYGGQDGDAFTVQRSTTDGTIDMSGLPADQEFIVVVNSDGYHNRRIYLESLTEQANVYLLPTSEQAVYNVFRIDDKSGSYPPGETRIIIQRALNKSGNFTWQTVSGDFFGSTNEHKTNLRYNVRYRLIVENDQGQRRMMGPYFATDENNPKVITVSSIVVSPPEGQSYYGTSWIEDDNEDDGQKTLRFAYTDPDEATDSLDLVIHERGNESNVLAEISTDNVGSKWTYSTVLEGNESSTPWVVDWQGQRNGEEIGAALPVGDRGGLPLPMDGEWLTRFGMIALVVVASLSSERMATIGAMGTVAFAGILMITGIWEIPVVLWFAALIIAVGGHALTKAQRGGVVG